VGCAGVEYSPGAQFCQVGQADTGEAVQQIGLRRADGREAFGAGAESAASGHVIIVRAPFPRLTRRTACRPGNQVSASFQRLVLLTLTLSAGRPRAVRASSTAWAQGQCGSRRRVIVG